VRIPFVGGTYNAVSGAIDASRAINFYPEVSPEDSKTPLSLIGTPGTALWATIGTGVIRGYHNFNGVLFVVSGNKLYVADGSGASTEIGTIASFTGPVSMENNGLSKDGVGGNQLVLVDGSVGYLYNVSTASFSQISGGGFPTNPTMVAYLDGYFIVISSGSMGYAVSDLYDGSTWNALAVAFAVASPEPIASVLSAHNQLWFLKSETSEVWYNSGTPTSQGSPFSKMPGGTIEFGNAAAFSVAQGAGSVFFLGSIRENRDSRLVGVMRMTGNVPELISPPAINYRIGQLGTVSDAISYIYTDSGHTFYVLTFPTGNWTIVYDATTNFWHERSTYIGGAASVRRHTGNCYAYFAGKHLIGDYRANGKIYEMSAAYFDDDGQPLTAIRQAQHFADKNDGRMLSYHRLHIDAETGVGTQVGQGSDPKAGLSWSDNGGKTWSNEYYASMGKVGEYRKRMVWRRLGASRDRIFRLTISDPVKRVILGAWADIT
jgi:hypothetical protein